MEKLKLQREIVLRGLSRISASKKATTYNAISQALPDSTSREQFFADIMAMK